MVTQTKFVTFSLILISTLVVGLLVPQYAHAGKAAPLYQPASIQVDCSMDTAYLRNIIRSTLQSVEEQAKLFGIALPVKSYGRGWVPTNKGDNLIEARLLVRSHTLVVNIQYDRKTVDVSYADSDNLNYSTRDNGEEYIHPNASKWLRTLESDLRLAISKGCNDFGATRLPESEKTSPLNEGSATCSVSKILQMKEIGMTDAQIKKACE